MTGTPVDPSAEHEHHPAPGRRTLLQGVGVGSVAAVTLTACGSGDSATQSASPTGPASPVDVASAADIPVGKGITVEKDGLRAVVGRPSEDTYTAFSPECPHEGCKVNPSNQRFVCPCHSSAFDMSTGDVLGGPAPHGLSQLPVKVSGGRVIVG